MNQGYKSQYFNNRIESCGADQSSSMESVRSDLSNNFSPQGGK